MVYRQLLPSTRAHHFLAIIGICLQVHIGIGGALMSYLLTDEVIDYVRNPIAFWITFFFMRIVFYNVVCWIAVKQGMKAAQTSAAAQWWVRAVMIWWFFSVLYHLRWLWRRREEIRAAVANLKRTKDLDGTV
jgi:hypothetical protein